MSDIRSEFNEELDHVMGWCNSSYHSPCWYNDNIVDKNIDIVEEDEYVKDAVYKMLEKYTETKVREARLNELGNADIAMDSCGINEMEEWDDYYKERSAQLLSEEKKT